MSTIAAVAMVIAGAYLIYVMVNAIFFASMTCASGFAGAYFLSCVQSEVYSFGLSLADMTGIALIIAAIYFGARFRSSFLSALRRLFRRT